MDGDGDLDVVAGNYGQTNRLYLNDGTSELFLGATGISIDSDPHLTRLISSTLDYFALWNPDVTKTQGIMEAFGADGAYQDGLYVDIDESGNTGQYLGDAFKVIGQSKRTSIYPGFKSEIKHVDIDEFMKSDAFLPYRQSH